MVVLTINGDTYTFERTSTLEGLLQQLNLSPEGIAVAVNGTVISKTLFHEQTVTSGDSLEIVRPAGGG